jgi:hypothetical protein
LAFVNKALLEHSHACSFTIFRGFADTPMAELSRCGRDSMVNGKPAYTCLLCIPLQKEFADPGLGAQERGRAGDRESGVANGYMIL